MKVQKSSIFRRSKSEDKADKEQDILHPNLTWPSSSDSEESSSEVIPTESNVDELSSIVEIESLKHCHAEEVQRLKAEIEALQSSNEALKVEKDSTERVMLQQEAEIMEKDSEILGLRRLTDALTSSVKAVNKESSRKEVESTTVAPEDIFGDEYKRKYDAAQTIVYHQEIDIVTKAEEISFLQTTLQAQEEKHANEVRSLKLKLLERAQEIETLTEKVEVTSALVSQTATMLLKEYQKGAVRMPTTSWTWRNPNVTPHPKSS